MCKIIYGWGFFSITFDIFNLNCINWAFYAFFVDLKFYITYNLFVFYHLACKERQFGTNCSQVCSPNCVSGTCRHTDGACTCAAGWTGYNCSTGTYCKIFIILYIHVAITEIELSQLIQIISKQSLKRCQNVILSISFTFSFSFKFVF